MRSIKFRAWDKKSKKMRIIDSIAFHGLGHFDIPTLDIKLINLWGYDIIEDKYFIIRRDPEQVKLLQYTGLKDKNGKEVYEGDILTDHGEEGPLYIEYSKERASFDFVDKFDQFGITRYAAFQISYEQFEVIGNIYEDKHLLEESK